MLEASMRAEGVPGRAGSVLVRDLERPKWQ